MTRKARKRWQRDYDVHRHMWSTFETGRLIAHLHEIGDFEHWCRKAQTTVQNNAYLISHPEIVKESPDPIKRLAEDLAATYLERIPEWNGKFEKDLLAYTLRRIHWEEVALHLASPFVGNYLDEKANDFGLKPSLWARFKKAIQATKNQLTSSHTRCTWGWFSENRRMLQSTLNRLDTIGYRWFSSGKPTGQQSSKTRRILAEYQVNRFSRSFGNG